MKVGHQITVEALQNPVSEILILSSRKVSKYARPHQFGTSCQRPYQRVLDTTTIKLGATPGRGLRLDGASVCRPF